jgi:NTE family protein
MKIALALQGGGAHGAYTWGVLDRLLEYPGLKVAAVSGASAGAVNAIALAEGWRLGKAEGAKDKLNAVWSAIATERAPSHLFGLPLPGANFELQHAALRHAFEWTRWMTPEQLNPLDIDPLRAVLDAQIDFEGLARAKDMHLFISATDIESRKARIFRRAEISRDVILASSCLPHLHRSVLIDGRRYWDGGLSSNPPLWPLIIDAATNHIVLVRLTGAAGKAEPLNINDIRAELEQLSFEAPLMAELSSIDAARSLARQSLMPFGRLETRLRALRLDTIGSPEWLGQLDPVSRADTASAFLAQLRERGRQAASDWLQQISAHLEAGAAS